MGHPALSVPERMIAELPSILAATGASIEPRPVQRESSNSASDKPLPNIEFFCSSTDGAVVLVRFTHGAAIAPDGLIVVLQPRSGKRRAVMSLLKQIELALRERGAVDLAEQQGITKAMIPTLPSILAATGAKVEQRPIQRNMVNAVDSRLPETEFVCSSSKGAAVVVQIARAAHVAPDGLTVVLHPALSPWWKRLAAVRLSKQIQTALREHGAVDLVKRQK
jgi:hypothetical protein